MRFVYTASVVSYILNDWSGINIDKVLSYIKESQCYDHGVAQGPCLESHGGSTYCAIASLALMGKLDEGLISKEQTLKWCLLRQETGFQGRPCKPVDTCYSFWIGGTIEVRKKTSKNIDIPHLYFNSILLPFIVRIDPERLPPDQCAPESLIHYLLSRKYRGLQQMGGYLHRSPPHLHGPLRTLAYGRAWASPHQLPIEHHAEGL